MKNILFYIVAVVAIVGGVIWLARPGQDAPIDPTAAIISALTSTENQYDFGTISMANGNVNKVFTVTNNSADPTLIEKIYTSCMCTSAKLKIGDKNLGPFGMPGHGIVPKVNQTLDPSKSAQIEVIFDPNAHGPAGVGPIERVVFVEEKGRQPLELTIKAMVTP
ncbi:MAG: DUF1573 domain-containing protein [Patescibacteria group bacterium]